MGIFNSFCIFQENFSRLWDHKLSLGFRKIGNHSQERKWIKLTYDHNSINDIHKCIIINLIFKWSAVLMWIKNHTMFLFFDNLHSEISIIKHECVSSLFPYFLRCLLVEFSNKNCGPLDELVSMCILDVTKEGLICHWLQL